ncbi:hypothetical protein GALL_251670 [mine drainage metagenome]|uniref:Uncharacterized protein n=1 Tax=mine drainage metagenome TaxID=410659 RepID=A0A1J5R9Y9_9ZZZZ
MTSSRSKNNNNLSPLIGKVKESMRHFRWQVGKVTFVKIENFITYPNFKLPFKNVNCFILLMVHMQRRASKWCYFYNKIIECTTGIFAGKLENKVATGTRL